MPRDPNDAFTRSGYWGLNGAAGCLFMANDTKRFLVAKRAMHVHEGGKWGTWGGAIGEGESPEVAAKREAAEECGYDGWIEMVPLLVFQKKGFTYHNFLGVVPNEFLPKLDSETEDYRWCDLESLKKMGNKHPGLVALLADDASMRTVDAKISGGKRKDMAKVVESDERRRVFDRIAAGVRRAVDIAGRKWGGVGSADAETLVKRLEERYRKAVGLNRFNPLDSPDDTTIENLRADLYKTADELFVRLLREKTDCDWGFPTIAAVLQGKDVANESLVLAETVGLSIVKDAFGKCVVREFGGSRIVPTVDEHEILGDVEAGIYDIHNEVELNAPVPNMEINTLVRWALYCVVEAMEAVNHYSFKFVAATDNWCAGHRSLGEVRGMSSGFDVDTYRWRDDSIGEEIQGGLDHAYNAMTFLAQAKDRETRNSVKVSVLHVRRFVAKMAIAGHPTSLNVVSEARRAIKDERLYVDQMHR